MSASPNKSNFWQKRHAGDPKTDDFLCKQCPECHGTGRKENGKTCAHHLSCPCRKCVPHSL